jgi:alpha-methylacyl-CoA racemase
VAALEPKLFAAFAEWLGLDPAKYLPRQYLREYWPALHSEFESLFALKPRDAWAALFEGTDACVAPVLEFEEAARHPHNVARSTFIEANGNLQPPPAPRFSRSLVSAGGHCVPGEGGEEALKECGVS